MNEIKLWPDNLRNWWRKIANRAMKKYEISRYEAEMVAYTFIIMGWANLPAITVNYGDDWALKIPTTIKWRMKNEQGNLIGASRQRPGTKNSRQQQLNMQFHTRN